MAFTFYYIVENSPVEELWRTIWMDMNRNSSRHGLNDSRLIARYQQGDKAPKIGMRIYRCTYDEDEDDAAWNTFMAILKSSAQDGFDCDDALDIYERFEWDVHEDKAFDGASVTTVQEHFQEWAQQEVEKDGVSSICYATRYNFCLYIEKECLEAVLKASESGDEWLTGAYVNIIAARRYAGGPEPVIVRSAVFDLVPSTYCLLADSPGWDMVCCTGEHYGL